MGQWLGTTNKTQSREELLYQFVVLSNIQGNTHLIVACKDSAFLNVAVAMIELGANVNAYGPAHSSTIQLVAVVVLLYIMLLEKGWRRLSRFFCLVWAVVLPHSCMNPTRQFRLQLAVYNNKQESQACTVIPLWKAKIEEPKIDQPDPEMTVLDQSTNIRYYFASSTQSDKHQPRLLYDACTCITEVGPTARHQHLSLSVSIQSAMEDVPDTRPISSAAHSRMHHNNLPASSVSSAAPSAPPIPDVAAINEGPINNYPSIDLGPVDFFEQGASSATSRTKDDGTYSSSSSFGIEEIRRVLSKL